MSERESCVCFLFAAHESSFEEQLPQLGLRLSSGSRRESTWPERVHMARKASAQGWVSRGGRWYACARMSGCTVSHGGGCARGFGGGLSVVCG